MVSHFIYFLKYMKADAKEEYVSSPVFKFLHDNSNLDILLGILHLFLSVSFMSAPFSFLYVPLCLSLLSQPGTVILFCTNLTYVFGKDE